MGMQYNNCDNGNFWGENMEKGGEKGGKTEAITGFKWMSKGNLAICKDLERWEKALHPRSRSLNPFFAALFSYSLVF